MGGQTADGVKEVQLLVLVLLPPLQVVEQALHADHEAAQEQPRHYQNIRLYLQRLTLFIITYHLLND